LPVWLISRPFLLRGIDGFIPFSMLFGLGLVEVVLPGLDRLLPKQDQPGERDISNTLPDEIKLAAEDASSPAVKIVLAVLFWQMVLNSFAKRFLPPVSL
jgi:hypothetical protein